MQIVNNSSIGGDWLVTFNTSKTKLIKSHQADTEFSPLTVLPMRLLAIKVYEFKVNSRPQLEHILMIHHYKCWKNGQILVPIQ